ncbi:MAG: PadR family transcriptional regulator [Actinomycetota bacterium]|jgi:poly-beta-hydroxybutyrate-responsive repressor|nr:PadR family transcriptional regulator [Actinomycetota bacterium]
MRVDRQPRCRCRIGPGRFEVRARIERFAEPAVLLLLAEGKSHGYQLAEDLEALLGEGRVDFGNLYRLLRSLEEEGLIASTWSEEAPGPQKRVYSLTGEGAALLDAWAASLQARSDRIGELLARYEALVAPARPRGTPAGETVQPPELPDDHGQGEGEAP